jgi:hypothetical protein
MTRLIPEKPTRRQAWKAIKKVCTRHPQRDEVYDVMCPGIVYQCHREVWVMRGVKCGSFQFLCYNPHVIIGMVKGRVKIWRNFQEPKRLVVTSKRWAALQDKGRAKFTGFLCTYRKDERDA